MYNPQGWAQLARAAALRAVPAALLVLPVSSQGPVACRGKNDECKREFDVLLGVARKWHDRLAQEQSARTTSVKEVIARAQQAKRDLDEDNLVMVIGAYSAGKSTLINSMVQAQVCRVGVRPTTASLQRIPFGNCTILDTPGLDAMNEKEHREQAVQAASRANLAVMVCNSRQPLRDSELPLLQELAANHSELVVALNYWKELDPDNHAETLQYVRETLRQVVPHVTATLVCVNAKDPHDKGVEDLVRLINNKDFGAQKAVTAKATLHRDQSTMCDILQGLKAEEEAKLVEWLKIHNREVRALEDVARSERESKARQVRYLEEELHHLNMRKDEKSNASGQAFLRGAALDMMTGGALLGLPTILGATVDIFGGLFGSQDEDMNVRIRSVELKRDEVLESMHSGAAERHLQAINAQKSERRWSTSQIVLEIDADLAKFHR